MRARRERASGYCREPDGGTSADRYRGGVKVPAIVVAALGLVTAFVTVVGGPALAGSKPSYCKPAKAVRAKLVEAGKAQNKELLSLTDLPQGAAKRIDAKVGEAAAALVALQAVAPKNWQSHLAKELAYQRAVKKVLKIPNSLHNMLLSAEKTAPPPNIDDAFNKLTTTACGFYLDR